jgi:hypothetical protein
MILYWTYEKQVRPRLTNYESEGFIARRIERTRPQESSDGFKLLTLARQKQKEDLALKRAKADSQAKDKILRKGQAKLAKGKHERDNHHLEKGAPSEDDDDNVCRRGG